MNTRTISLLFVLLLISTARAADLDRVAREAPATGALVTMLAGAQSATLGIQPGDIITHYDNQPIDSPESLVKKVNANKNKPVNVTFLRDGRTLVANAKPGRLGLHLRAIEKGKPLQLRPPATDVVFDFSSLKDAPRETWLAFYINNKKVGYEFHRLSLKGDELTHEIEVAFDGEGGRDPVAIVTTARLRDRGLPLLLRSRHITADGEFLIERVDAKLKLTLRQPGKPDETRETTLPEAANSDYLVAGITGFLPLKPGACVHYDMLNISDGTMMNAAGMAVKAEEEIDHAGKNVKAWRIETWSLGHIARTTWLDTDGRELKNVYGGGYESRRATKEEALKDVPEKLKPRLLAK